MILSNLCFVDIDFDNSHIRIGLLKLLYIRRIRFISIPVMHQ